MRGLDSRHSMDMRIQEPDTTYFCDNIYMQVEKNGSKLNSQMCGSTHSVSPVVTVSAAKCQLKSPAIMLHDLPSISSPPPVVAKYLPNIFCDNNQA